MFPPNRTPSSPQGSQRPPTYRPSPSTYSYSQQPAHHPATLVPASSSQFHRDPYPPPESLAPEQTPYDDEQSEQLFSEPQQPYRQPPPPPRRSEPYEPNYQPHDNPHFIERYRPTSARPQHWDARSSPAPMPAPTAQRTQEMYPAQGRAPAGREGGHQPVPAAREPKPVKEGKAAKSGTATEKILEMLINLTQNGNSVAGHARDIRDKTGDMHALLGTLATREDINGEMVEIPLHQFFSTQKDHITAQVTSSCETTAQLAADKVKLLLLEQDSRADRKVAELRDVEKPIMALMNRFVEILELFHVVEDVAPALKQLPEAVQVAATVQEAVIAMARKVQGVPSAVQPITAQPTSHQQAPLLPPVSAPSSIDLTEIRTFRSEVAELRSLLADMPDKKEMRTLTSEIKEVRALLSEAVRDRPETRTNDQLSMMDVLHIKNMLALLAANLSHQIFPPTPNTISNFSHSQQLNHQYAMPPTYNNSPPSLSFSAGPSTHPAWTQDVPQPFGGPINFMPYLTGGEGMAPTPGASPEHAAPFPLVQAQPADFVDPLEASTSFDSGAVTPLDAAAASTAATREQMPSELGTGSVVKCTVPASTPLAAASQLDSNTSSTTDVFGHILPTHPTVPSSPFTRPHPVTTAPFGAVQENIQPPSKKRKATEAPAETAIEVLGLTGSSNASPEATVDGSDRDGTQPSTTTAAGLSTPWKDSRPARSTPYSGKKMPAIPRSVLPPVTRSRSNSQLQSQVASLAFGTPAARHSSVASYRQSALERDGSWVGPSSGTANAAPPFTPNPLSRIASLKDLEKKRKEDAIMAGFGDDSDEEGQAGL